MRLAVVGGGFTGVVLIVHVLRTTSRPLDITVIEPAGELGRGIAYGTTDTAHRINVPSDKMGLSPDDPCEATRWLFEQGLLPDEGSADDKGHFYVPRHAYGAYMGAMLRRSLAEAWDRLRFRHLRNTAISIDNRGGLWTIGLDDGAGIDADVVALCFGHAVPHLPCALPDDVGGHPKFIRDPWSRAALAAIEPADHVLIVGTGLTMADVVVSLRNRGHAGLITAISRRGLVSRPQGRFVDGIDLLAGEAPPATALGLLRLVRRRVREAPPDLGWQPIADAVRASLPVVWRALPAQEKARVLRRLLPFWDVHRFRLAPQMQAALERELADGGLRIGRAGLAALARADGRFVATLARSARAGDSAAYDAVVLCTGPDKNLRRNPLVASLLGGGFARLDDTGVGLAVDADSRILDPGGTAQSTLLAFGPMTRGTFGEMTGAPDIVKHVSRCAKKIAAITAARPQPVRDPGGAPLGSGAGSPPGSRGSLVR